MGRGTSTSLSPPPRAPRRSARWPAAAAPWCRPDMDSPAAAVTLPVPDSYGLNLYRTDATLARLASLYLPADLGLMCPVRSTDSLTRTLRKFGDPALLARYLPGLLSQDLDTLHQGAMFMTEQGAGSDVGATAVSAVPQADGTFALHGDKWFGSNPDAELAMVLARPSNAPEGIEGGRLFVVPRTLPAG